MRGRAAARAALLAGAVALLAGATPALGASRTLTVEGWLPRTLAFSGDRLVWSEAATVRVDPRRIAGSPAGAQRFDYYRAEAFRIRVDKRSARFVGAAEVPVSVRTSIAAMSAGGLAPTGAGGFVLSPGSRRFAPPVIWCCDATGTEVVIDSDGRPDAAPTVAATWTGSAVRYVTLAPDGAQTILESDPAGIVPPPAPVAAPPTRAGLVALAGTLHAWVDPAAAQTLQVRAGSAAPVAVVLPGAALHVWAGGDVVAVAVRSGGRVALLRVDAGAMRPVRVWSGARVPRGVAVGGGAVAVADGRRVLASRRGALRALVRTRRPVDAVGVDGRRLAWIERGLRRGSRVGVVRLGRVR